MIPNPRFRCRLHDLQRMAECHRAGVMGLFRAHARRQASGLRHWRLATAAMDRRAGDCIRGGAMGRR